MAINLRRPERKNVVEKVDSFEIMEKKQQGKIAKVESVITSGMKKISEADVSDKLKNTGQQGKEIAMKGLKGGLVGAGAMAANGVVAGATGNAIGALTATGLGGVVAGTSAGAAIVSAVPVVAGFGVACLVGSAISDLVNKDS